MKKIAIPLILFINITLALSGQNCLPDGIIFTNQNEIDSFSVNYPDCTHILGDVKVDIPSITLETNLEGLSQITQIDGSLTVRAKCPSYHGLHNIDSVGMDLILISTHIQVSTGELSNLKYVGGDLELNGVKDVIGFSQIDTVYGKLMVWFGDLKNFEGLNNLKYIRKNVWISESDSLQNLFGLHNLREVGEGFNIFGTPDCPFNTVEHLENLRKVGGTFAIESFPHLKNLSGLDSLKSVGGFSTSFSSFESLDGLQGLTKTASVKINSSPHMKVLTGLENLVKVGYLRVSGCDSIVDLSGLNSLQKVDDLLIFGNDNLVNLKGLENLDTIFNDLRIHKNPVFESFEGLHTKAVLGGIWFWVLPELEDFSTFCCLDHIGEIFSVLESGITSLAGLEAIERLISLRLGFNENLQSLNGVENLTELNFLSLFDNEMLSDIDALSETDPDSYGISANPTIIITDNPMLSNCSIEPICLALEKPEIVSDIENNLTFCDTRDSILSQCLVNSEEEYLTDAFVKVFPNPVTEIIWAESEIAQSIILLNSIGHKIKGYRLNKGVTELDVEDLPSGVYFLKAERGEMIKVIKI